MKKLDWTEERNIIITLSCDDCKDEIAELIESDANEVELTEEDVEKLVELGCLEEDVLEALKNDYVSIVYVV